MKSLLTALVGCVLVAASATFAAAAIEKLTLPQMIARADGAVHGEILSSTFHQVPHPLPGGGDLYYTSLVVAGTSLYDGTPSTVTVSFAGGMTEDGVGVWNSEAPAADETRVGREVVVFYKWSDDMGGGFASNALYAAHGGLFTVFETRRGKKVVQGRGQGYAVARNISLDGARGLTGEVRRLAEEKAKQDGGR